MILGIRLHVPADTKRTPHSRVCGVTDRGPNRLERVFLLMGTRLSVYTFELIFARERTCLGVNSPEHGLVLTCIVFRAKRFKRIYLFHPGENRRTMRIIL